MKKDVVGKLENLFEKAVEQATKQVEKGKHIAAGKLSAFVSLYKALREYETVEVAGKAIGRVNFDKLEKIAAGEYDSQ